jgi:hypothetical protein
MPTAEASVETKDPARYLAQFCKHAAAMNQHAPAMLRPHTPGARTPASAGDLAQGEVHLTVECSETYGVVTFTPWGRCSISVDGNLLRLRADAMDADGLQRIQDVMTGDLERWGARENLKVAWRDPDPLSLQSVVPESTDQSFPSD